jgi:hypothetical protein
MHRRYLLFLAAASLLFGLVWLSPTSASASSTIVQVANGHIKRAEIVTSAGVKVMPTISSGTLSAATPVPSVNVGVDSNDVRADNTADPGGTKAGATINTVGCSTRNSAGDNVRVNQDCSFRRQAEESITVNPADPSNLVAGQNDSRLGFNHCGIDYSFDSGRHWGDQLPPFWQHLNNPVAGHTIQGGTGSLHTYDAASDPAVAVDSQGRAFFSCVAFDLASNANAVIVAASVPGAGGSFYNNVPALGSNYIAVEDNNPNVVHDKEFIAADANPNSPNRDNVYVTWTVFLFGCGPTGGYCSSAIFGSMSTNHGVTWSQPEEISGSSTPLCFQGNAFDPNRSPNACDFDQGSDPVANSDGSLTVAFNNSNTAATNPNAQQLAVSCHPSGKSDVGTARLNCGSPAKVGNDVVVGEPLCDFGRGPEECIPGAYIRTNDFPRISRNSANGDLFAVWQDYRTGEFDVHVSGSTDNGRHWTEATKPVNSDTGWDHYFAATSAVAGGREGETDLGVSYYRTFRVLGEGPSVFAPGQAGVQAEPSGYFLAGGTGLRTPFMQSQVSPTFGPPAGIQTGFNGDYSGLVMVGHTAHPIWSDTRNIAPAGQVATTPAPDEDVFTDSLGLPG